MDRKRTRCRLLDLIDFDNIYKVTQFMQIENSGKRSARHKIFCETQ